MMGFSLKVTAGPGAGQSLSFDQAEVTFGRTADNDVVLYDPNVSRRHFHIVVEGEGFRLEDLGSSNGTSVNGEKVESRSLRHGDEFSAGDAVFVFQQEGAQARTSVPARRARAASSPARARGGAAQQGVVPRSRAPEAVAKAGPANRAMQARDNQDDLASLSARERFRRQQALKTPVGRIKNWYGSLPEARQKLVMAGGGVGVLLLLLLVIKGSGGGVGPILGHDYSSDVLDLDAKVSKSTYGYNVTGAKLAQYQITFKFRYLDGRATLYYDAGFVDSDQELEIRLNDERVIGYAPLALHVWEEGQELILPLEGLEENEFNTLTFDNTMNPSDGPPEDWAVRNVRIVEEALPEPDAEQAQQYFTLAKGDWDKRLIAPENLYNACKRFRLSRDYLERIEDKPPLYAAATSRARECRAELNATWEKLKFTFIKALEFKQWAKAKGTLRQALKYFPDESDPKHQMIKAKIYELE